MSSSLKGVLKKIAFFIRCLLIDLMYTLNLALVFGAVQCQYKCVLLYIPLY